MAEIVIASDPNFKAPVRELLLEYFRWVNTQLDAEFGFQLDIDPIIENDLSEIEIYFPPQGRLFLARAGDQYTGIGFLTELREGVGEIRRMYVRPEHRRQGTGRGILETAIDEARKIGYKRLLLESPKSWTTAHSLYSSAGFTKTEMYPESEVPEEFRQHWIFMELSL